MFQKIKILFFGTLILGTSWSYAAEEKAMKEMDEADLHTSTISVNYVTESVQYKGGPSILPKSVLTQGVMLQGSSDFHLTDHLVLVPRMALGLTTTTLDSHTRLTRSGITVGQNIGYLIETPSVHYLPYAGIGFTYGSQDIKDSQKVLSTEMLKYEVVAGLQAVVFDRYVPSFQASYGFEKHDHTVMEAKGSRSDVASPYKAEVASFVLGLGIRI